MKIQLSIINSKQINEVIINININSILRSVEWLIQLNVSELQIEAPQELSPLLKEEERGSQKITVKLFLSTVKQEFVTDALDAGNIAEKVYSSK